MKRDTILTLALLLAAVLAVAFYSPSEAGGFTLSVEKEANGDWVFSQYWASRTYFNERLSTLTVLGADFKTKRGHPLRTFPNHESMWLDVAMEIVPVMSWRWVVITGYRFDYWFEGNCSLIEPGFTISNYLELYVPFDWRLWK